MAQGLASPDALDQIVREMDAVEAELGRQVQSQVRLVEQVGSHTLSGGGKRLRPAFLALSARATGLPFDRGRASRLGACLEMIHMATLIHDDVIDRAETRRGRETASAVFGNTASILSGDVLLAKAMSMLAQDGDLGIIRMVSASVVEMAEGEVRELEARGLFDIKEDDHLEILRMKTASFIRCCCEAGAMMAGAPEQMRSALGAYGYHIGMAFQIVDDLLDYRGKAAETGKPRTTDFREGCATLPLIYLRNVLSETEDRMARAKFGNGVTDEELALICEWMKDRGPFDQAQQLANHHVKAALDALAVLPATDERKLLEIVADFVVLRQS
jgi:octaprenyl-diphosphate synthase